MKEYRIGADGGKELAISRWPDGKYSIKVFSSLGQMVAHLIAPKDEGEKLTDALNNLRQEFDLLGALSDDELDDLVRERGKWLTISRS